MASLKRGDRIDLLIRLSFIVGPYKEYDDVKTFEIVSVDTFGYYLYVPPYIFLKGATKADERQCKLLEINKKFLDENIIYVEEGMIYKVSYILDGMNCNKCKEFFMMAGSNQEDGSMICYSCRQNPYR